MNLLKILTAFALAAMFGVSFAADTATTSGPCSPAFADVTVKGDFKPVVTCGIPVNAFNGFVEVLRKLRRDKSHTDAQLTDLVRAINVMLSTLPDVQGQLRRIEQKGDAGFAKVENLGKQLEILIEQNKAKPGADLEAEARQWRTRYEELLKKSQIADGSDPRDRQIIAALQRFDVAGAAKLSDQVLKEQGVTEKIFAGRYLRAARIEQLRSRSQAAFAHLEKALALAPDDFSILWVAGDLATEIGRSDQAAGFYRRMLARAEAELAVNPGDAEWIRNLSVSHEKIGEMKSAQGDSSGALKSYLASLAIRQKLAAADPGSAQAQQDLAISHAKTGGIQLQQGGTSGALQRFKTARTIFQRLAAADRTNVRLQQHLEAMNQVITIMNHPK